MAQLQAYQDITNHLILKFERDAKMPVVTLEDLQRSIAQVAESLDRTTTVTNLEKWQLKKKVHLEFAPSYARNTADWPSSILSGKQTLTTRPSMHCSSDVTRRGDK
ncbi:hypothetical protein AMECASPLE_030127 [Ameca splendens]|uniref:Uncharacterized protein n=1 Tax=Ameca splendens TaxID=208324 RepID=A0ABV1ADF2_9TELE